MSIMDVLRKDIGGSKTPKAPKEPKNSSGIAKGPDAAPTKALASRAPIAMSSSPRANLLPPEVMQRKHDLGIRRRTWWVTVVVVVLVLVGVAGSFVFAQAAATGEATAEAQQAVLRTRLSALDPVKNTESDIATLEAARKVAGSTDIDWQAFDAALQASLPAGTTVTNLSFYGTSATTAYQPSLVQGGDPVVATVTLTATTPTIPVLSNWVDGLSGLPGYINASFGSVSQAGGSAGGASAAKASGYQTTLTVSLSDKAFSHYYLPATKEASK